VGFIRIGLSFIQASSPGEKKLSAQIRSAMNVFKAEVLCEDKKKRLTFLQAVFV
jgi:hypothetical protein